MYQLSKGDTFLITGATGLIGQALVRRLLESECNVIAVVRNLEKGMAIFGEDAKITYIVADVTAMEVKRMDVDYIIHAASNTSSKAFVDDPIGIISTAYEGTKRTLEIARLSKVKGYVYLSSMEVYGIPTTDEKIDELHGTNLDTMRPRSAYPESKRMCENLCTSYASQYNLPAKVVRLTQTFGPGVKYNDGRVFAEFARCTIEGRDIVLHTKGETRRNYLYTEDAVDAIIVVLMKGEAGEAYNAANEETYCSILELASMFANKCSDGRTKIVIEDDDCSSYGYAPTLHMNLDSSKLRNLGWKPHTMLEEMINRLLDYMKCESVNEKRILS